MAAKVEVLCPNGHRVYVKITPNTKLVNILEVACVKQGFQPTADYELVHVQTRKVVDLTLTVRFAGLPNNAKLELVKAAKSREIHKVAIGLQLPTGERMKAEFDQHESIWSVMEYFEKENSDSFVRYEAVVQGTANIQPVCVYLREEIIGEFAMRETTLKDLGLMSGSGILRLLHKSVEPSMLKDIEEKIKGEKLKRAMLMARTPPCEATPDMVCETSGDDVEMEMNVSQPPRQDTADGEKNVVHTEESNLHDRISFTESGTTSSGHSLTHSSQEISQETQLDVACHRYQMGGARPKEPWQVEPPSNPPAIQPVFADFKFPEETKGQNLYSNEMADEREIIKCMPCDRNVICYNAEETKMSGVDSVEPDDKFFELTEEDVKKMYMDLQQRLKEDDETQLLTQAMRKAKAEQRLAKYDYAFIRFMFPDKLVLQAMFRPREPVYNLYKFITEQIQSKSDLFHLFTSPPKHILKDKTLTLIEARLVPMTVVYVGLDIKLDRYLSDAVLSGVSSQADANMKIVEMMYHSDLTASSADTSKVPTKRQGNESSAPRLPKWFKTGRK